MKGFITRTTLRSVFLLGGLIGMVGCAHYNDVVDPCYPERYEAMARKQVNDAFGAQVTNGHVLDQTVWESHFKEGTSELSLLGREHLDYIIRRRPCADTTVYVQTAGDIPFDPANPGKFIEARNKLNFERKEVVEKYLAAASNGRNLTFEVKLHDPATAGMSAVPANAAIKLRYLAPPGGTLQFTGGSQPQQTTVGNTQAFP
jgi:hypothetical protein